MTKTKSLPKTQAAALEILIDGMSSDEWIAAGAHTAAVPALRAKGLVTMTKATGAGTDDYRPARYSRAV